MPLWGRSVNKRLQRVRKKKEEEVEKEGGRGKSNKFETLNEPEPIFKWTSFIYANPANWKRIKHTPNHPSIEPASKNPFCRLTIHTCFLVFFLCCCCWKLPPRVCTFVLSVTIVPFKHTHKSKSHKSCTPFFVGRPKSALSVFFICQEKERGVVCSKSSERQIQPGEENANRLIENTRLILSLWVCVRESGDLCFIVSNDSDWQFHLKLRKFLNFWKKKS